MSLSVTFARWLGRFPCMSHSSTTAPDGRACYAKARVWHAPLSRPVGNAMLRARSVPARMLGRGEWFAREQRMFSLLYGMEVYPHGRSILIPALPGVPLNTLLVRPDIALENKLVFLREAAAQLSNLHRLCESGPDGPTPVSHGDASVLNVLVDPDSGEARWFDFDTAHFMHIPAPQRHADDLRAFLVTASSWLPAAQVRPALEAASNAYDDPEVIGILREQITSGSLERDLYHLAHATQQHEHLNLFNQFMLEK